MNTIKYYLLILFIGVGLVACNSEQEEKGYQFTDPNMGALYISTPQLDENIPMIVTRSADFSMLDPKQFIIEIYQQGETSYYKRYDSFAALKQEGMPLELPVGTYTVRAFSYDSIPVLREQPYFMGEAT
ncbi:MAG: DUF4493 domain-containing protein [Tannerellaceae bacterium]|nr:DUF4493 domain-containing protein [Tannerellaceae bacterium]